MIALEKLIHAVPKERESACITHGQFTSICRIGTIWSGCPKCSEEQRERETAEAAEKKRLDELHKWHAKVGAAAIPPRFQDRSLKNYVATTEGQKAALRFAVEYADNFDQALKTGRSAVFIGKPGTGKTHLAAGIAQRLMARQNRTVLFTTVRKAIASIKATWSRDSSMSEMDAVKHLATPDLLILDEVGVQFGTDTEKLIMFDILNERYETRRPTILMSNLTAAEVTEYLGERIADRLREDGGEYIVFDWESFRGQNVHSA